MPLENFGKFLKSENPQGSHLPSIKLSTTGVARNFDWGGGGAKLENFCDVILVTFFGDVMVMTSLK